jgi:hypothetical protein
MATTAKLKTDDKELEQLLESALKLHPDLEYFLNNPNAPLTQGEDINGSINSRKTSRSVFSKRGDT